jgi:hypothetical protein
VERYVPKDEFRKVLEGAPAGVLTAEAWVRRHERLKMFPSRLCLVVASRMARTAQAPGIFFGR